MYNKRYPGYRLQQSVYAGPCHVYKTKPILHTYCHLTALFCICYLLRLPTSVCFELIAKKVPKSFQNLLEMFRHPCNPKQHSQLFFKKKIATNSN